MKMTNFQIIFTGIFVMLIIFGMISFALYSSNNKNAVGSVVIWGTVDQNTMASLLTSLFQTDKSFEGVTYVQKTPDAYASQLIDAMASGSGPDLVLINQNQLQAFSNKLQTIPYNVIPQSTFTGSYIDEGQVFLTPQGEVALPFLVDPLVLYWNRDLFQSAGLAQPPQYWSELITMAPKLTVLNGANIQKSAAALGEWRNISYAKDILAALFMQAGDGIVTHDANGATVAVFGATPPDATENPATSALQFYTEFANPSKVTYSWNRSLPNSQDYFVAGNVAAYVGYASDFATISARNPNLRFAAAILPQIQGNGTRLTFGNITGLSIPRTAKNPQGALTIAEKLSSTVPVSAISSALGLPPVRVDIHQDTSASASATVFYQSALIARAWFDPDTKATNTIFQTMIESVISGKSGPDAAVSEAASSLGQLVGANVSQ